VISHLMNRVEMPMPPQPTNPILDSIRRSLRRKPGDPLAARPTILPPRAAGDPAAEIDRLLKEINALSGAARRLAEAELDTALAELVSAEQIKKAVLWPTAGLADLRIAERLHTLGVEIVSPAADKHILAECDLGVTEADYALPETGTLGLLSSAEKPRAVSLLPRVHLAIVRPQALRADLHQVFAAAKDHHYLIFITGPSRTADIELTVTLGVHGPKALYVWVMQSE
jgi:L-lactate dehydrogenase complex protein LldG